MKWFRIWNVVEFRLPNTKLNWIVNHENVNGPAFIKLLFWLLLLSSTLIVFVWNQYKTIHFLNFFSFISFILAMFNSLTNRININTFEMVVNGELTWGLLSVYGCVKCTNDSNMKINRSCKYVFVVAVVLCTVPHITVHCLLLSAFAN